MNSAGMETSCVSWLMPFVGMGSMALLLVFLIYIIVKIVK